MPVVLHDRLHPSARRLLSDINGRRALAAPSDPDAGATIAAAPYLPNLIPIPSGQSDRPDT